MDTPLDDHPDLVWKGVGIGAGMLGALVARTIIHRVRLAQGKAGQRPGKLEALLWTALVGAGAQVGRLSAQRAVAAMRSRREAAAL